MPQVQVLGFEYLDFVATAIQSADEPATGLAFLDEYSIVLLGDPSRVKTYLTLDGLTYTNHTMPILVYKLRSDDHAGWSSGWRVYRGHS